MKSIIGMVCCLNESEFLDDFFKHNLRLVDKMIVATGAVIGYPFATPDGHSIDDTNKILNKWEQEYPDKIVIIKIDRKWKSKQSQQNSMLKYVNDGDWCFIFGADEFYMPDTRKRIEKVLEKYPNATEITWPTIHFFNDNKHLIVNSEFNTHKMIRREQRFFKYEASFRWVNHPTINNMYRNVDTFFDFKYAETKINLGMSHKFDKYQYRDDLCGVWDYDDNNIINRYHYGFIRNISARIRKHIYYLMRDRNFSMMDAIDFISDKTNNNFKTLFGYINQIHQTRDVGIGKFIGKHPLSYRKFNNSVVDLNDLKEEYKDFNEKPVK